MEILADTMVVIILQYINVSTGCTLKPTIYVNYFSIKLEKKGLKLVQLRHITLINCPLNYHL